MAIALKSMNKKTKFTDLGRASYQPVWQYQTELLEEVKCRKLAGEETTNHLLFVEHPHVYTLGKSGDEANMLINTIQLRARDAEFVRVDRGGDITYHGPGQVVAYPIFNLENFSLGVKEYVYRLEEVVIRFLAAYGISAGRLEGATGVWLDPEENRSRKICAIGIKCSRYITMHGFALNVNTDLDYFNYINPCGFVDKGVTSLAKELGYPLNMEVVKEEIKAAFKTVFELDYDTE